MRYSLNTLLLLSATLSLLSCMQQLEARKERLVPCQKIKGCWFKHKNDMRCKVHIWKKLSILKFLRRIQIVPPRSSIMKEKLVECYNNMMVCRCLDIVMDQERCRIVNGTSELHKCKCPRPQSRSRLFFRNG